MYGDEALFLRWIESLAAKYGRQATDDFHAETLGRLARMARRHEQDMTDMQAAKLLPEGVGKVVEVQGCHRSTAYRRVSRGNKVARLIPGATVG